jgi:imidazolonepropionase-like amidohydrolase
MKIAAGLVSMLFVGLVSAQESQHTTAVTGATLIDGTGTLPIPNAVIVWQGDKITCVGITNACTIAGNETVIDATGKWVIPGLIDTHVHPNWTDCPDGTASEQLRRLAFGTTTTRDAGTGVLEDNVAARTRAESPTSPEPRLVISGLMSDENAKRYATSDHRGLVRKLASMGADAIKVKHFYTAEELDSIISEAHQAGLPVFGHTWGEGGSDLREAVAAGINGISHMSALSIFSGQPGFKPRAARETIEFWVQAKELWNRVDDGRLQTAMDMLITNRVWLEPMLVTEKHFTLHYPLPDNLSYLGEVQSIQQIIRPWVPYGDWGWPAMRKRRERIAAVYQHISQFVRHFHEHGGLVVAGTDDIQPGLGLLDEIYLLTESGLSPMAALQAATEQAATALGRKDLGTIAPGKLADLLILDGDPLRDPANLKRIRRVLKGGHPYDPVMLLTPTIEAHKRELQKTWALPTFIGGAVLITGIGAALWLRRRIRRSVMIFTVVANLATIFATYIGT